MSSTKTQILEKHAATARDLANGLFAARDEVTCSEQRQQNPDGTWPPSCLQKEEDRPLTKTERQLGWARRPFNAYDPARMCNACVVYFYAEMSAQILHKMHCWSRRGDAEEERKRVVNPAYTPTVEEALRNPGAFVEGMTEIVTHHGPNPGR